ncbi:hypothetical protein EW093_01325 [Thiospirochaeta perfilievii]|uniref:Uncharacterized protein n=1 Tax=Thiospirochaeta perfilievii TaxID=252967 RepID=A0A5C1Q919_9SPIO|nr:WYL domain-containing protein [Thiospirochaeta perfilievii]QEN03399.1 hypothetical protein EW093_01325 [Thiospirochaeta perfilievii]
MKLNYNVPKLFDLDRVYTYQELVNQVFYLESKYWILNKIFIAPTRDGGLYFFTTINDYTDIRTLAVERIINLSIGDSHFETPTDFDPQDFLDTTFNLSFGEQE